MQRFDVNGDGVLDKAEQVIGRRIMVENFLDKHANDLHLYDRRLAQKVRGYRAKRAQGKLYAGKGEK